MRALPVLLLLATPALAQEVPSCGGVGAEGAWIGGDAAASDVSTAEAALTLDAEVPIAGRTVALLRLSQPTGLRVEAAAPDGDPYLALLDADGAEVASDDDGGGALDARAEADLPAGDYCLVVRSYAASALPVTLAAGTIEHEPITAGEAAPAPAPETAAPEGAGAFAATCEGRGPRRPLADAPIDAAMLSAGVSGTATLADTRTWGFALSEPAALTVTATSADGDPVLGLHRDDGTLIAENDDTDGLNSRVDTPAALPAGAYCLELDDLNGDGNAITVALAAFDPQADRLRRIADAEIPPAPSDPVAVEDLGPLDTAVLTEIGATSEAAWFAFDLPEGGVLLSEAVGVGDVDPALRLFDRLGRVVAENDDAPGGGLDSFLVTRVLPGRYVMAVRLVSDGQTGPVRLLLERYVPAR